MLTEENRFWSKVDKTASCWLWTAAKRNKGYGAFCYRVDGKMIQGRAHRYSYEIHSGAIPDGLFVLHRCDTPACVNPAHLFLGTNDDNVQDMMRKGRHVRGGTYLRIGYPDESSNYKRGEDHHSAKLAIEHITAMRSRYAAGGISYSKLGRQFGVNTSCAYKVVKRLLWRLVA